MLFTTILALTAAASASAASVRRFTPPAGWWTDGLEPYDTYHERYLAIDCEDKHNTAFFDACCHPLLKSETLAANRPAECNPANAADDDCDDEPASSAAAPAATPAKSSAQPVASTPAAAPINVAPAPVTSKAAPAATQAPAPPKPSPSSAPAAPKPSSSAPAPAPSPPASSNGQTGNGEGTFFFQNGVAGACGNVHADNSKVVALDIGLYGNNCVGQSSHCGKTVTITNTKNGKSVDALVADCCPTCVSFGSIDMSVGAFTEIATEDEGEVPITWVLHN